MTTPIQQKAREEAEKIIYGLELYVHEFPEGGADEARIKYQEKAIGVIVQALLSFSRSQVEAVKQEKDPYASELCAAKDEIATLKSHLERVSAENKRLRSELDPIKKLDEALFPDDEIRKLKSKLEKAVGALEYYASHRLGYEFDPQVATETLLKIKES